MKSCLGCTDRHIGCHGTCKDYLEAHTKRQKINAAKYEDKHRYTSEAAVRCMRKNILKRK